MEAIDLSKYNNIATIVFTDRDKDIMSNAISKYLTINKKKSLITAQYSTSLDRGNAYAYIEYTCLIILGTPITKQTPRKKLGE